MLPEISLSILDIAQNSITAGASKIDLLVEVNTQKDILIFDIRDDGCGMGDEMCKKVVDPFYTSRKTRKVGLGIPFLKQSAQATQGSFELSSKEGVGTHIKAVFQTGHIDCMPLGDLTATIHTLVVYHEEIRFVFCYIVDGRKFVLDTSEVREILGDVSFREQEVSAFLKEYIQEHIEQTDGK
ncbi:ATP-binding protein [Eubacterium oxidoreducens]|uniref:Histidine kinase-, DNA gyrase B-, and HSP90-like ATPase n=1 Tax=Eubacterium oxidoreducens TaxID=1732 RepID=A0A1G6BVN2_EUBOX|nr:ATP-binding protein [Eubacterium oxidoreducens]SDB24624.1 Histidine kinase-, DNA gyrase B-, and HSP90-like ATPase [Eubacterium oxidoreducens]